MRIFTLTLFLALLQGSVLFAQVQRKETITGSFSGTFDQVVQQVESNTSYHFFYKPEWTDSVKIAPIVANAEPIRDFLTRLVAGTDLRVALDRNNNIYITKEREMLTELPDGFFPDKAKEADKKAII